MVHQLFNIIHEVREWDTDITSIHSGPDSKPDELTGSVFPDFCRNKDLICLQRAK